VKKCAPNCSSPASSTVYAFTGEKVLAEYDNGAAANSPTREYIYSAAGALLARFDGSTLKYYQQDYLSNQLITDSSGSALEQKGHLPFGEDWYQGGDKWKFTTYERDPESGGAVGNDYAMARYYISRAVVLTPRIPAVWAPIGTILRPGTDTSMPAMTPF
jgi:hypothetical protein